MPKYFIITSASFLVIYLSFLCVLLTMITNMSVKFLYRIVHRQKTIKIIVVDAMVRKWMLL